MSNLYSDRIACQVLLAEDCPDMVRILSEYLNDPRVLLTLTSTGRNTVAAFQNRSFDLVLMDIQLPDMNGIEATQEIRKWEAARSLTPTPIAALTALSDIHASGSIFAAGCTLHLVKPIARQTLLQIVGQYSSQASTHRPPTSRRTVSKSASLPTQESIDAAVRALVPDYLTRVNENVVELEDAHHSGRFDVIQRFGHQMKGSGSPFGFPKITEYGRELERAAAQRDELTIAQQIAHLRQYLTLVSANWCFSVQGS